MEQLMGFVAEQGLAITLLIYIIITNVKREKSNEEFNHELIKQVITDKNEFSEMKDLLNRNYSMISENRLNIERLAAQAQKEGKL